MIVLDRTDAGFLSVANPVHPKTFVRSINKIFTMCTNERYTPKNRDARLTRVNEIAQKFGVEPIVLSRPVHIYCGKNYLPALAEVGSNNFCLKRGHKVANQLRN